MLAVLVRRWNATKLLGSQVNPGFFTELEERKDQKITTGRAWRATELRLKSDDDLHKLWYVLLREKSILISENQYRLQNRTSKGPQDRLIKVKISQARLLTVVHERHLIREQFKAALEKEYIEAHYPTPPPKPKAPRLLTDREKAQDAKRREAIKAIKHWRTMTNKQRRTAIKQQYGHMAKAAKEQFVKELRYVGQQLKDKQASASQ